MTQIEVALDRSLEPAWSVVDEEALPALTRGVWASNGLRIGLLPRERLAEFLEALPESATDRRRGVLAGAEPVVLLRSRPLRAAFFADLTVPPFATKVEPVRGHVLQLLMSMRPSPAGFTTVTLTPHHHRPRQSLLPRTPQEKLLDGRVFEELRLSADVPEGRSGRLLVLGLARDELTLPVDQRGLDEREDTDEGATPGEVPGDRLPGDRSTVEPGAVRDLVLQANATPAQPDLNLPSDQAEADPGFGAADVRVEPLPLNLGRALMTKAGLRGENQVLLLMEVEGVR